MRINYVDDSGFRGLTPEIKMAQANRAVQLVLEIIGNKTKTDHFEVVGMYLVAVHHCGEYALHYDSQMRQYLLDGLKGIGVDARRIHLASKIEQCRIFSTTRVLCNQITLPNGKTYQNVLYSWLLSNYLLSPLYQFMSDSPDKSHMLDLLEQMLQESNPFKNDKLGKGNFLRITHPYQVRGAGPGVAGWLGKKLYDDGKPKKDAKYDESYGSPNFNSIEEGVQKAHEKLGLLCSNTSPLLDIFTDLEDREGIVRLSRATVKAYIDVTRDKIKNPRKYVGVVETQKAQVQEQRDEYQYILPLLTAAPSTATKVSKSVSTGYEQAEESELMRRLYRQFDKELQDHLGVLSYFVKEEEYMGMKLYMLQALSSTTMASSSSIAKQNQPESLGASGKDFDAAYNFLMLLKVALKDQGIIPDEDVLSYGVLSAADISQLNTLISAKEKLEIIDGHVGSAYKSLKHKVERYANISTHEQSVSTTRTTTITQADNHVAALSPQGCTTQPGMFSS